MSLFATIEEIEPAIPWEDSLAWVFDSVLKLPADHIARTLGLIGCFKIDSESTPTSVELWVEPAPHFAQPAAFAWALDKATGNLFECPTVRGVMIGNGKRRTFRVSVFPNTAFTVYIGRDTLASPPWEDEDGHGPVRKFNNTNDTKRQGELVLHTSGTTTWVYDWDEALRIAERDGWNTEPYGAPNRAGRAVLSDFNYLQAYLHGKWHYVTVDVFSSDGTRSAPLGGVESLDDSILDAVTEMVMLHDWNGQSIDELAKQLRQQHTENQERAYWEARDVVTR